MFRVLSQGFCALVRESGLLGRILLVEMPELDIKSCLLTGLQLHQNGKLDAAERAYLTVLARDQGQPDALHLLGVLKGQQGNHDLAVYLIEKAIAANPSVSSYFNNLGNILVKTGQFSRAEEVYRSALRFDRCNADAHVNLGKLLQASRQFEAARKCYVAALNFSPRMLEARMSMGRLEAELGRWQPAISCFHKATQLAPFYAPAYLMLGNAYKAGGGWKEAEAELLRAIACDPEYADAHFNFGNLRRSCGMLTEAVESYRKAIHLSPSDAADAYNNLGVTLSDLGRREEALTAYLKAIELKPEFDEAYSNYGKEAIKLGNHKAARNLLERALVINPLNANAYHWLGALQENDGMLHEAARLFRRSLELDGTSADVRSALAWVLVLMGDPGGLSALEKLVFEQPLSAYAHWIWSTGLLLHGYYNQGWKEYEWRTRVDRFRSDHPSFDQPQWQGERLEGKSILLYAEQGYGDTLQFARYVPLVAECGGHVILKVQPPLQRLLQGLPGVDECVAMGAPTPRFSTYAPLMSLPRIFKTTEVSVPPPVIPVLTKSKSQKYPEVGELQVGLAWAGNSQHVRDRLRSIPLGQWKNLSDVEHVQFTSLQYGQAALQAKEHGECFQFVEDCGDAIDFADTANVLLGLDLVITVDTAVAHLAGTMGIPVWILLYNTVDWRWGLQGKESVWYPSAKLFRQTTPGDWSGVLADVKVQLQRLATLKRSGIAQPV